MREVRPPPPSLLLDVVALNEINLEAKQSHNCACVSNLAGCCRLLGWGIKMDIHLGEIYGSPRLVEMLFCSRIPSRRALAVEMVKHIKGI